MTDLKIINKERHKQALIIAGSSLLHIEQSDEQRELFLKISDQIDVVLACRVSPK